MRERDLKKKRQRWIRNSCILVAIIGGLVISMGCLIKRVGGAFSKDPHALNQQLSPGAKALVQKAFEGLDPRRLLDHHVHVVGLGAGGTGCFVNPHMRSWWHPVQRVKFAVYASACGIEDASKADEQVAARLHTLVQSIPQHGKFLIFGFDKHYKSDGTPNLAKTEFYVPNHYVVALSEKYPDSFVPAISIHPYRKDALAELDKWAQKGVRVVKWLPNAMGIDPASEACVPFYWRMKEHGMILLSHAGEEKAVEAEEDQKLGNPLRLRKPLDLGLRVIVAHSASLGMNEDLDDPKREQRENFDLFMRLMDEKKYDGLLFGEISAVTQFNRLPRPLVTLLQRTDLHHRLVNGSDYPLPAINIIIRTRDLVKEGLITEDERRYLNEVYDHNPLLFDFVVKRTLKAPGTQKGFPPEVFTTHSALEIVPVST